MIKRKKWLKYILYGFMAFFLILIIYGISLYCRRNAILHDYVEKELAAKYPSLGCKLNTVSFSDDGKGIQAETIKIGHGAEPDCEIGQLKVDVDLSLGNLRKGNFKPTRLVLKDMIIRLKSKKLLKGFHQKLKEIITDQMAWPVVLSDLQIICLPDSNSKKKSETSSKITLKFNPPGTVEKDGKKNTNWTVEGTSDRSNGSPLPYNGEISTKLEEWLLKTFS